MRELERLRLLQMRGLADWDGELTPRGERFAERLAEGREDPEPMRRGPDPDRFWDPGPMNDCGTM